MSGTIYTPTKAFHFPEVLEALPSDSGRITPPLHVRIKPTNVCNQSCWFCAYGAENLVSFNKDSGKNRSFIPVEKMAEIVNDVISMGVKAVTFSGGGEPFVHPSFFETITALADSEVRFGSLTNGTRLKGEIADIFSRHGTWVRVSIDGWDDESYSQFRSVRVGEHTKVMKNMEEFKKLGGSCSLAISLIIDAPNAPHIYEFLRRLKDIGADSVKLSPVLVSDDQEETNCYHDPFRATAREQIDRAKRDLAGDGFELSDAYMELKEKYDKDYTWCPYIAIRPVIGADLKVYACPDKAYNLDTGCIGSIAEQSFCEFWFSDKNRFLQIDPSRDCRHHCELNAHNKLILDYLNVQPEHGLFV